MPKYIKILLEVGIPGFILRCSEYMELKDSGKPVAFLAKMTCHQPLADQLLSKGLLDPSRVRKLLDGSSPREVVLDILMIVSDLARMDKVFYEHINGAELFEFFRDFLSHEDPNVCAKVCSAIGNICRHSPYFYKSLERYQIIGLIDQCADPDKRTRKFACFAALQKLVADCSVAALSPSRRNAVNESPLNIALFSLAKMCAHPPCKEFLR
ncbi:hypothetical protein NE237_002071 [Protea cynaroides]|uniref:non-specific serine/threonine protein kinase n=1 Tax=Protea cynaroides TaxID=273540 RepID=A0A9Q0QZ39_9MAGN|nr:hypothetical protein NE237_002071 [Protea cynaroides]